MTKFDVLKDRQGLVKRPISDIDAMVDKHCPDGVVPATQGLKGEYSTNGRAKVHGVSIVRELD